jgi:hypothetical protein
VKLEGVHGHPLPYIHTPNVNNRGKGRERGRRGRRGRSGRSLRRGSGELVNSRIKEKEELRAKEGITSFLSFIFNSASAKASDFLDTWS